MEDSTAVSQVEVSEADPASYMNLLTSPAFKWRHTECDDETEELWLQLCLAALKGISGKMLHWLEAIDPPSDASLQNNLSIEQQETAASLLTMLRVGQNYWGVGITAGRNLADIGAWAGTRDAEATITALNHLRKLIREHSPALETELFRHAKRQASRRIESWLGSISSRAADVLVQRYGLRGQQSATMAEVGQSIGVSRARVQQIESRALRRLGPAIAEEIRTAGRAGSRRRALERAFQLLPARPGKDVHRSDVLLNLASSNEAWWTCGIAMLYEDVHESTENTDKFLVREWLKHRADAIWLDDGVHFMKRRSERKNPYISAARKLLAIHEAVSIGVVHEALIDAWRSELWGECMLTVDWLGAYLRSSELATQEGCLVRNGLESYSHELSPSERQLLTALQELGGVCSLEELRERLPGLRQHGSTLSQMLYSRTPIIQHIGPSIFGIRGATHDSERVAILEDRALRHGHPWLDRGGWKREATRSLEYRLPSRDSLPSRIRLPNDIADSLFSDGNPTGALIWRIPDGLEFSVGVHVASAGAYLTGVGQILNQLYASGGDTIRIAINSDDVWAVSLTEAAPSESIVVRMGRGWTSVAL